LTKPVAFELQSRPARINGSADALPVVAAVDNDKALVLTGKDIQYLSRINAFASTDDGRPILQRYTSRS